MLFCSLLHTYTSASSTSSKTFLLLLTVGAFCSGYNLFSVCCFGGRRSASTRRLFHLKSGGGCDCLLQIDVSQLEVSTTTVTTTERRRRRSSSQQHCLTLHFADRQRPTNSPHTPPHLRGSYSVQPGCAGLTTGASAAAPMRSRPSRRGRSARLRLARRLGSASARGTGWCSGRLNSAVLRCTEFLAFVVAPTLQLCRRVGRFFVVASG